jgi:hypothetical protein
MAPRWRWFKSIEMDEEKVMNTKSRWWDGGLRVRARLIAKVDIGGTAGNDGQWRAAA